jgi:hypothetical protein
VAGARLRPLWWRVVRAVVLAIVLGEAVYVVAINATFATPLFESIVDSDPLTIDIHYERGWSLLPGRIHAKRLSIRGRDSNVEWILRLDDVTFDVSLWGLLRRRFDVSRARGSGLSLRLRSRIDAQLITPEKIANLPPVDGFGPVPLRPFQKCTKDEWSDADYHLWTIHLANVVADNVREVWIDDGRFQGRARVQGGFYLRPIRSASVGPASVDISSGSAQVGATSWLDSIVASADVTVGPFDPRADHGDALLHRVSLDLGGRSTFPTLANLPISLPDWIRLAGRIDMPRLDLHVKQGVVRGDSHVDARMPRIVAAIGPIEAVGALSFAASVAEGPKDQGRLDVHAALDDVRVGDGLLQASRIAATGDAFALDLAHPLGDLHFVVESDDLDLPDARALLPYLHSDTLALRRGRAHADSRVEMWLADRRAEGRARVRADDVELSVGKTRASGAASVAMSFVAHVAGPLRFENLALDVQSSGLRLANEDLDLVADVRANARLRNWLWRSFELAGGAVDVDVPRGEVRFNDSRLAGSVRLKVRARPSSTAPDHIDLSGSAIDMHDVQVSSPSVDTQGWQGQTVMQPATLRVAKEPELEGELFMDARDASPFLAVLVHSSWPRMVGLTQIPHLAASARVTLGAHRLALDDVDAEGGDVALRGMYAMRDTHRRGEFTLEKGPLSIGLHVDDDGVRVHLFGLEGWSQRERDSVEQWVREAPRR